MNNDYLAKPAGECHGDEHLCDEIVHSRNCVGDPDIYCSCQGERDAERERINYGFLKHENWKE